MVPRPISFKRKDSIERARLIKEELKKKPRTSSGLSIALSIKKIVINNYLKAFKKLEEIHISSWTYNSEIDSSERRIARPVYCLGKGKDASKPDPKTTKQMMHDYYVRTVTQPENYPKAEAKRKRRKVLGQTERLKNKLKRMPASNPIEAMVNSVLVPKRRRND